MIDRATTALLAAALLCACGAPPAQGPDTTAADPPATAMLGDAEVTATLVPTAALGAAIASRYGVERQRGQVLVVVALREDGHAVAARVQGRVRDLRGVSQPLEFREVRAGDAPEYVALVRTTPPDTLRVALEIVDVSGRRLALQFHRDIGP